MKNDPVGQNRHTYGKGKIELRFVALKNVKPCSILSTRWRNWELAVENLVGKAWSTLGKTHLIVGLA